MNSADQYEQMAKLGDVIKADNTQVIINLQQQVESLLSVVGSQKQTQEAILHKLDVLQSDCDDHIAASNAGVVRAEEYRKHRNRLLKDKKQLMQDLIIAVGALHVLSKLGNGSELGTSDGNVMAQRSLARMVTELSDFDND